jgi:uncharacterized protein (TIGR03905 family)
MKTVYQTRGGCAGSIALDVEDGVIKEVTFKGGCDGNLKAIEKLVSGMQAKDAIEAFAGIRCGRKNTSCPDQLAKALLELEREQGAAVQ